MNDAKKVLQMNEEMTIMLAKQGHPDAFLQLYEMYGNRIYRLAFRHTNSKQDAEDIMQETFIKAYKRLHTFKFNISKNFSSWLNTICLNCTIDHFRKHRSKNRIRHVSISELTHELHSQNPSPEINAEYEFASQHIRQALNVLPPKQRLIFEMRYNQQTPIKEIAEDLQCSQSTIKTQIFRAQRKLRKTLEPIWGKP